MFQQNMDEKPVVINNPRYALMTAACNEEAFIEKTIASVLSQAIRPVRWVIVSDGSTDRTDEIVQKYAERYKFIRLLCVTKSHGRSFGAKVQALRKAEALLDDLEFDFIGNLDADITIESSYFEQLIAYFEQNPKLGLAMGWIYEEKDGRFQSRRSNRIDSVSHAAQLVRRGCYEEIGGYEVLKYGGEDWYAQTKAKMSGWNAQAFPGLRVFHHRHTGSAANLLRDRFRLGRLDYSFGSDPAFEIFKCLQRLPENPWIVGGIARLAGFFWSYLCADTRPVPSEFVEYLRREQRSKLSFLFRNFEHRGVVRARLH